jgi:uncharacterized protein
MSPLEESIVRDTRCWLERAVIGLNLCPFAKAVHVKDQVHYAVCMDSQAGGVLGSLAAELDGLVQRDAAERDTTLLILPLGFDDFLVLNDFMARAERLARKRRLDGIVQLAHFHPRFRFEGTEQDDITNCTNRAPYPTIHLIREASIDRAVQAFPNAEAIYEANMETMRRLGPQGWAALDVGPSQ